MANDLEYIIMQLITYAGDARSLAIQAIRIARQGDFSQAKELMKECESKMIEAHTFQSQLIFSETNGVAITISLLMVHAQDHVMNALTIKELAIEMIGMLEELKN